MLDVPDEARADHVERAGFRGENAPSIQVAQDERPDAEGIANADEFLVGERDQGVAAFDLSQSIDETVNDLGFAGAGDQMKDDLGIRRRLKDRALGDELVAQEQKIGQVAVVGDGDAAGS
jgi:hypothetical protein